MILRPRYPLQFFVALLVAVVMWYALSGERRENTSERGATAALTLVNLPRDLVVTSSVPETVVLRLRGPLSLVADPRTHLEVLLDLADAHPGLQAYTFDAEKIDLPAKVAVVNVEPPEITLELERLATQRLPVQPVIEGVPAVGFVLGEVRVVPDQVVVRGPGSRLTPLEHVQTTPVSVEGATAAVEASVELALPNTFVRPLAAVPILVVVDVNPEPIPRPSSTPSRDGGGE